MAHTLPDNDFRTKVWVLDADDFAWSDGEPAPPPSDLIDEKTWSGIQTFAQSVSVITSNCQGTLLKLMYDLWGAWLEAIDVDALDNDPRPIDLTMSDVIDEFQASIFNCLHGFYRQAIGCLRNVVELVVVGAYCEVCGKSNEFKQWRAGAGEVRFDTACARLAATPATASLDAHLHNEIDDSLFDQKRGTNEGGWARRLYAELCMYAHSRTNFINPDLWEGNGPNYSYDGVIKTASLYLEALALCFTVVKLSRPAFELPHAAEQLYSHEQVQPMRIAYEAYEQLFLTPSEGSNERPSS
jgi:hypothetical protein